jgi:hypothetical protein
MWTGMVPINAVCARIVIERIQQRDTAAGGSGHSCEDFRTTKDAVLVLALDGGGADNIQTRRWYFL